MKWVRGNLWIIFDMGLSFLHLKGDEEVYPPNYLLITVIPDQLLRLIMKSIEDEH